MTINNMDKLKNIVSQQPYPLLFATVSGAHLYGFPSPDSDYDLRGVHILPLREVVGLDKRKETVKAIREVDGIELDLVTHDLHTFFALLLKRSGSVLEQLYSPIIVHTTPEHARLKDIALGCVTKHHAHHYFGFSKRKWEDLNERDIPQVKPLLYVYRILLTGIHLMRTGEMEANLAHLNEIFKLPYIPDLIERKKSGTENGTLDDADLDFHKNEYTRLVTMMENARDESHLPDNPTQKPALNDLLMDILGVP